MDLIASHPPADQMSTRANMAAKDKVEVDML
jgi:hypothetical protein